jgi:hypothetical protein
MTRLAKILVSMAGVVAVVGVAAIGLVAVLAVLQSDDGLDFFAVPLVAFAVVIVVGTLVVLGVIAQGVKTLRERPEDEEPLF